MTERAVDRSVLRLRLQWKAWACWFWGIESVIVKKEDCYYYARKSIFITNDPKC
jgi:hypothetical protein